MKALAIISQDKKLYDLCCKIQEKEKFIEKKIDQLREQAKKLEEELHEDNRPIWNEIESHLKQQGLLSKDFDGDKDNIGFSLEKDIVYRGTPEPSPQEILESLFNK